MTNDQKKNKFFGARFLPSREAIENHRTLRVIHRYLKNEGLWHLNHRVVPRACLIGLFCACLPIPFQMLLAAVLAILIRANVLISVALVWLSNPLTMGPWFYLQYQLGRKLLGLPPIIFSSWHFSALLKQAHAVLVPLLLGSIVVGVSAGLFGYLVAKCAFWVSQQVRTKQK